MAGRLFSRLVESFKNFFIRIDDNLNEDILMSQTLQGKVSLFAAMEAQKSRELGKDLIIHISFFAIFIAILFMQREVAQIYDINQSVGTALINQQIDYTLQPFSKTYLDVGQWEEFRDFVLGVLVEAVTQNIDYANHNISEPDLWTVQYVNKIVGAVRFRTMRVKNESCTLSGQFRRVSPTCFSQLYTDQTKDKAPYGPPENPTMFTYTEDSGGVDLFGHIKGFWDTSGYVVDIPLDDNFSTNVNDLVFNEFWGYPTRAVVISMVTVAPNYHDKATVLYMLAEFTAGGQINPYVTTRTFRVNMYISTMDDFRIFLEIVFALFVIYYIVTLIFGLIVNIRVGRWKEFVFDLWNIIETVNLILYVVSIVQYLSYLTADRSSVDFTRSDYIVEMEHLASQAVQFYQISAINILLSALKTFKYLQLSPRLYVLWETMHEARVDLATYMVMFLIILFGFLFFGWLTFGPDISQFNGFANCLGTLWQFLIGNPPDYDQLAASNRVLGPVYYALFTIFVFFILVNMFVAIVSNSFDLVASRTKENKEKLNAQGTAGGGGIKKPLRRMFKTVKAVVKRKPLYSETELLRMLKHREILEKETLTKQDIEQELRDIGEEPMAIYIERIQAVHEKRRKFLMELTTEEHERQKEKLEEEYERRLENGEDVENLSIKLQEVDFQLREAEQIMNDEIRPDITDVLNTNNNNNNNTTTNTGTKTGTLTPNSVRRTRGAGGSTIIQTADPALLTRMEMLEAKMDTILLKLDIWAGKQQQQLEKKQE
eukprot:Phypoly_transcript_03064.p1 GENE.Phypoly_transcript_03064~~Phypoly_transcript_03064.p1  ORF type:complete len:770 (+),score=139.17 Phypoly_transcript_03064:132-2441(+)